MYIGVPHSNLIEKFELEPILIIVELELEPKLCDLGSGANIGHCIFRQKRLKLQKGCIMMHAWYLLQVGRFIQLELTHITIF